MIDDALIFLYCERDMNAGESLLPSEELEVFGVYEYAITIKDDRIDVRAVGVRAALESDELMTKTSRR